jgi:flagellar protein FliS
VPATKGKDEPMYSMNALQQYQNVDIEGRLAAADPHAQISLLMDSALKRIAIASGATRRGDIPLKGRALGRAIDIIDSLRAMLDHERGGSISDNLEALYSYMLRRLVEANHMSDTDIMAEVGQLLGEIKSGWDQIPQEARN